MIVYMCVSVQFCNNYCAATVPELNMREYIDFGDSDTHKSEKKMGSNSILINADNVKYDYNTNDITLNKDVVIDTGRYNIIADYALYNKNTKIIIAKGNVKIKDLKSDNLYNVSYAEIDQKINKIYLSSFHSSLRNDKIKVYADNIQNIDSNDYELHNVTMTPCKICADNFVRNKPLWQLRAKKVTTDFNHDKIKYKSIYIDFWGKEAIHLPSLSTPSFNTKYKTGFLLPSIYSGGNYGLAIGVPYYLNFSSAFDATITPYISNDKPPMVDMEVRGLSKTGGYVVGGGITRINDFDEVSNKSLDVMKNAGYIYGLGNWLISDKRDLYDEKNGGKEKGVSRRDGDNMYVSIFDEINKQLKQKYIEKKQKAKYEIGFNYHILFDKSKIYLKKYNITQDDILLNKLYFNYFNDSGYLYGHIENIQDLRNNGYNKLINVAPRFKMQKRFNISHLGNDFIKIPNGSILKINGGGANIVGKKNVKLKEFFINFQGNIPFLSKDGQVLEIIPGLDSSVYIDNSLNTNKKLNTIFTNRSSVGSKSPESIYQITPNVVLSWRWPWLGNSIKNKHIGRSIILEPVINLRLEPMQNFNVLDVNKRSTFPSAYDLLNPSVSSRLFDQRFGGSSMQYGVKATVLYDSKKVDFMVAQSKRFYTPNDNYADFNIKDIDSIMSIYRDGSYYSDYMMYLAYRDNYLTLENRMWMNNGGSDIRRNEFDINFKLKKTDLTLGYIFSDYKYYNLSNMSHKHEISFNGWHNVYQRWWLNLNIKRKLDNSDKDSSINTMGDISDMSLLQSNKIMQGIGIRYKNECLQVDFGISRNYLKAQGLKPATTYMLNVHIPVFY